MDYDLSSELKQVKSQSNFVHGLLGYFGDTPEKLNAILKETDFSFSQYKLRDMPISSYNSAIILRNINALAKDDWVFKYEDLWSHKNLGGVGMAAQSAGTIDDALEIFVQYSHLEVSSLYFERFSGPKTHRLSFGAAIGDSDLSRMTAEITSINMFRFLQFVSGSTLNDCEVWFSYPAPQYAHLYRNVFTGPIKFGKTYNAIILPKSYLALQSLKLDPKSYMVAMTRLMQLAREESNLSQTNSEFVSGVAQYLSAFIEHRPDAESTAHAMSVSRRTMTRKLRAAGTTFSTLLEEARKTHAYALKKQQRYTQGQIAEKLGYQDQASFSRAWRRWENKAHKRDLN